MQEAASKCQSETKLDATVVMTNGRSLGSMEFFTPIRNTSISNITAGPAVDGNHTISNIPASSAADGQNNMSSITTGNVGDRKTTVFSQNISSTSKPRIPEKLLKQPHSFDPTKHEIHSWVSQFKDNISSWGVGEDNYYNILKQYVPDQYKDMVHGWSGDAWNVIEGKLVAFFGN
jgi:hypothetical protein